MKAKDNIKSPAIVNDPVAVNDLSKFTIFYLFQFEHLPAKVAHACTFSGLDNAQMIIDFFAMHEEMNCLIFPYWMDILLPV